VISNQPHDQVADTREASTEDKGQPAASGAASGQTTVLPLRAHSGPGYAVAFNGSPAYLEVPAANWFSGDLTIEAWVYMRSYNFYSRLLDFGNGPTSDNVLVALTTQTSGRPVYTFAPATGIAL